MNIERELPADPTAEMNLLGSILLRPEVLAEVSPLVRPADFIDRRHAKLYSRMIAMIGKRLDVALLMSELTAHDELDAVGGMSYLGTVTESVVNSANAVAYAHVVRERSQRRQLIQTATRLISDAYDAPIIEGAIQAACRRLDAIDELGAPLPVVDARVAAIGAVERILAAKQSRGGLCIPSGVSDYDRCIGGWVPGELVVLAARPGNGKTAFAMQTATSIAGAGRRVLYFTGEMAAADLALRAMAGDAAVDSRDIRAGSITDDELDRLVAAGDDFARLPLHLMDSSRCSVAEIRRAARQVHRAAKDLALIVVDYIGLVTPVDGRLPRHEQVSQITRDLKALARDMNVPVLALAQLNRESDKSNRPKLSNLRESGGIEQDADVVLFIHRPELAKPDDKDLENLTELIVAKNRHGQTLDIELFFDRQRTRFAALEKRYAEFDAWNSGEDF